MPAFDATDALDDLFGDGSYADGAGAAVATRTERILDGPRPEETIEAVLRLADALPDMQAVREVSEGDTSDLTDEEKQQKAQTEEVIRTALATGDASVWVVAQGLDRAAKGKWWRRSHSTFGAYVEEITGKSAVYGRQLRNHAPLALEMADKTGSVPNPGQVRAASATEKQYGTDAAVTLYEAVREASAELGEKPTAAALRAAHLALPATLPDVPEQQRVIIEQVTRQTLGLDGAAIAAPSFDSKSNTSAAIAAPEGAGPGESTDSEPEDDIEDAEIVPDHLATLKHVLKSLTALNAAATKDVFTQAADNPAERIEYAKVRASIIKKATALRNKALQAAPGVDADPDQEATPTT